ncbi:L-serine dehydratase, beta subunit [Bifidobacterium actinocoloniiforme DSM 22766]|uniref:L-serine dehydratase n=1 Tax=Bifidobacterium actinocoloniiforme DSM 22766 TaxID=1437605 RepID=A0A086Z1U0_9BIFI|nr:L-serine ammonia-lyase, iron-sulfur-dependent subunit beta [Bifidobacterium actinocoloniiforme]AKV55596.1 serine dehydratase [Bifidobacterium actinocoloniiforme DSM 22766]KFI40490.1 L-serine dehydratase, beta subunit [Bifidobacterium actinocoloniiforme DSM 22766]
MSQNYKSVFDIIGPVMIGPSSSHTAGAVAIGRAANSIIGGPPDKAVIRYYESFAQTHKGHGTDYAIVSGLLGFEPDDSRVPQAVDIARGQGIDIRFVEEQGDSPIKHPNTAILEMTKDGRQVTVSGCSIGGGTIEIRRIQADGFDIQPGGLLPFLLVEEPGTGQTCEDEVKPIADKLASLGVLGGCSECCDEERGKTMYAFDLDKPLTAQTVKDFASHSSRISYIS